MSCRPLRNWLRASHARIRQNLSCANAIPREDSLSELRLRISADLRSACVGILSAPSLLGAPRRSSDPYENQNPGDEHGCDEERCEYRFSPMLRVGPCPVLAHGLTPFSSPCRL